METDLRDYFAAKAITGLADTIRGRGVASSNREALLAEYAAIAYALADAMLIARAEPSQVEATDDEAVDARNLLAQLARRRLAKMRGGPKR